MLAGLVASFAASGQVTAVSAQGYNNRAPDPNTPRIMVAALKSSGGEDRVLLERLVVEITGRPVQSAGRWGARR